MPSRDTDTLRARAPLVRQLARLPHSARHHRRRNHNSNRSHLGPDLALMRVRRPV